MNKRTRTLGFGLALRTLRKDNGLTQEQLALECGFDRTYLSLLELDAHSPTLEKILTLCDALGVSLPEFAIRIESAIEELKRDEHRNVGGSAE